MVTRTARILLWLASAAAIGGFLVLAAFRLRSTHPAGAAELAVLDHAQRILRGQTLYGPPTHSFEVPLMPGMPLVVSWLVAVFGAGLWVPRLVTLASALAVAALALVVVRAETRSGILGMVSAGLLLAGISVFTLREGSATPEPLAMALGLAGLAMLRFLSGWVGVLGAAAFLSAAFFVHPLAAAFFVAAGLSLREHRRHCLLFVVTSAILCGGGYVLLSERLGPWFNFNAWDAPLAALRFRPVVLLHAVGDEILGRFGVLTISALLAFALPVRPWRGPTGLWLWCAVTFVALALVSTQSVRVSPQDLAPALVALAILGPISAQRITQHLAAWPGSSRFGGQGVVLVALTLQFVMLLAGATAALLPPPPVI